MNVLVLLETSENKFKKQSFELISFAKALAEKLSAKFYGVTFCYINNEEIEKASNYGLENLIIIDNEKLKNFEPLILTQTIFKLIDKYNLSYFVFPHNTMGKAIGPSLSAKINAAFISGVIGLPESINPFIITKKVYTGNAFAKVKANTNKVVLTLFQNSYGIFENKSNPVIINEVIELGELTPTINIIEKQTFDKKISLHDAEVVVSGGRGMKGPENWYILEELAKELNAALGCTRPVSDEGWRPHHEHVGQTGKIIAPNLYIACGISGAIQHIAGASSSKYIIAINKDPEAPIFEYATYGIVTDALKYIPALTQEIRKFKKS